MKREASFAVAITLPAGTIVVRKRGSLEIADRVDEVDRQRPPDQLAQRRDQGRPGERVVRDLGQCGPPAPRS